MNKNNDIEKELREIGSNLPVYQHSSDGVPSGYFDQLEKDILSKTVSRQHTTKVVSLRKWMPAVAAGLAVIFSLLWSLSDTASEPISEQYDSDLIITYLIDDEIDYINSADLESLSVDPFEELSYEDVESYIDDNIEDIDQNMIGDINW